MIRDVREPFSLVTLADSGLLYDYGLELVMLFNLLRFKVSSTGGR